MPKSTEFARASLAQSFQRQPPAWLQTADHLSLSLHAITDQASPSPSNEINYRNYQAITLPRDTATWQLDGAQITNQDAIRFAACMDDILPITITHWALTPQGESQPAYSAPLDRPLTIDLGARPVIEAGHLQISEA